MDQQPIPQFWFEPRGFRRHDRPASETAISRARSPDTSKTPRPALPLSTSCSSAFVPLAPPTKSMRVRCGHRRCRAPASAQFLKTLQSSDSMMPGAELRRRFPDRADTASRPRTSTPRPFPGAGGPFHGERAAPAHRETRRLPFKSLTTRFTEESSPDPRETPPREKTVPRLSCTSSRARAALAAR